MTNSAKRLAVHSADLAKRLRANLWGNYARNAHMLHMAE